MAFTPFIESDQPTMAAFNEKFSAAISTAINGALDAGAKVEIGSYTGTGTFGKSNPNVLSFGFAPKFVFVYVKEGVYYFGGNYGYFNGYFVWGVGLKKGKAYYESGSVAYVNFVETSDGLEWYITAEGGTTYYKAEYQLNQSGVAYGYFAIG